MQFGNMKVLIGGEHRLKRICEYHKDKISKGMEAVTKSGFI